MGLKYLHELGFIHMDIKIDNIVIDTTAKLIDFGSCLTPIESQDKKKRRYTPSYASPEIHLRTPNITFESDIWSFGIIIYRIYYNKHPLHHINIKNPRRYYTYFEQFDSDSIASNTVDDILGITFKESLFFKYDSNADFLKSMLSFLPENRISSEKISSWLESVLDSF